MNSDADPSSSEAQALRQADQQVRDALRHAFDPDKHATPVSPLDVQSWLHAAGEGDAAVDAPASASRPWMPRAMWIGGLVAACVVVGLYLYVSRPTVIELPRNLAAVQIPATTLLANVEERGFRPDWTCEPDEFPQRLTDRLGVPTPDLTALPDDLTLLGWTFPDYTAGHAIARNETTVLVRSTTGEQSLLILSDASKATEPDLSASGDANAFFKQVGNVWLVEVTRSDTPVMLPLVEAP
ncbi:MAG: hypothetical protein AAGK78_14050 [Planctomycetota bacterium]